MRAKAPGLNSDRRRDEIRLAAYRCFRDNGYQETTVDAICDAAGGSKGSFYWYFGSKQDVFVDILETWTREVMDQLYRQFEVALRQDDFIRATTEALEREIRRGRVLVPLWLDFSVYARNEPPVRETLARFYRRARAAIAEMLRPGLESHLGEDGIQGIAAAVFGSYVGVLMQDLADPERADARAAVQHTMTMLGHLLRPVRGMPSFDQLVEQVDAKPEPVVISGIRLAAAEWESVRGRAVVPMRGRLDEVRALVLTAAPELDERFIPGWKTVGYELSGMVCSLKAHRDTIRLSFQHGKDLNDADGVLTGPGKRARYLELSADGVLPAAALYRLVRCAADLSRQVEVSS